MRLTTIMAAMLLFAASATAQDNTASILSQLNNRISALEARLSAMRENHEPAFEVTHGEGVYPDPVDDYDEQVAVTSTNIPGYLGLTGTNGVLQIDTNSMTYTYFPDDGDTPAYVQLASTGSGLSTNYPPGDGSTNSEYTAYLSGLTPDHSFKFVQTNDLSGRLSSGLLLLAGENTTITNLPTSITVSLENTYFWVDVNLNSSSANWYSGASWPAGWGTDTNEIVPILHIQTDGSTNGIIYWKQHRCSDMHITRSS